MPQLMPQIVVPRLFRCDDGTLPAARIPKRTGHGFGCRRDRNARDAGAIFVTIGTNQVLHFRLGNVALLDLGGREAHRVHSGWLHGLAGRQKQDPHRQQATQSPQHAQAHMGQHTEQPERLKKGHSAFMQSKNKCPSCECVVRSVVAMVQRESLRCQTTHPSGRTAMPSLG